MPSPKELRAAIVDTRARLHEAVADAHAKWSSKPASGEGEAAWSPSEAAKHVIGAERYFTNLICKACGAPEMERGSVDASTPGKAAASLSTIGSANDGVLRHVSDGDMSKTSDTVVGTMTVEQMLNTIVHHTEEHIAQIRAALT